MKHLLTLLSILITYSSSNGQGQENLKIVWPEEYKWKIGSNQENETMHMMELIPGKEKIEKWTILGTMISIKGATNVPMDKAMNMMYDQAKHRIPIVLHYPGADFVILELRGSKREEAF